MEIVEKGGNHMTEEQQDKNMRDYLYWLISLLPKEEIKYDTDWRRFNDSTRTNKRIREDRR